MAHTDSGVVGATGLRFQLKPWQTRQSRAEALHSTALRAKARRPCGPAAPSAGTSIAKLAGTGGHLIMAGIRKRSMKKLGLSFALVSSLAVAAYAATTWSQPPDEAECLVPTHSAMPISAALEQWRCSESHASAAAPARR